MSLFSQRTCPTSIIKAFRDGEYTDLTITCEDSTFEVHQVVVCTTCDFFKQSIRFGKEAEEKRINLPEDDPEMIRRLIAYLYLGDYDPAHGASCHSFSEVMKRHPSVSPIAPTHHPRYRKEGIFGGVDNCACLTFNKDSAPQPASDAASKDRPSDFAMIEKPAFGLEVSNPLTIHATMYSLGDKYQVDGLCALAKKKFEATLHHHANSADFVFAIQIAYSTTPDSNHGLRNAIVEAFLVHFHVKISDIPGAEERLDKIDDLAFLMIKSWPVKTEPPPKPTSGLFGPAPSPPPAGSQQPPPTATPLFGTSPRPATTSPSFFNLPNYSQPANPQQSSSRPAFSFR